MAILYDKCSFIRYNPKNTPVLIIKEVKNNKPNRLPNTLLPINAKTKYPDSIPFIV